MGSLAANGAGVKKLNVEGYLYNVAQIFSGTGADDPRLDAPFKIDVCLSWYLCAYTQAEPPPDRVLPYPIEFLQKCWRHLQDGDAHQKAIADLL